MTLATTCPQCKTSFKVVPDQLKLRRGLVRCGRCQHVFSGIDTLTYVDWPPRTEPMPAIDVPQPEEEPATIIINLPGHPTITSSEAEQQTDTWQSDAAADAPETSLNPSSADVDSTASALEEPLSGSASPPANALDPSNVVADALAQVAPETLGPLYETDPNPLEASADTRDRSRPMIAMLTAGLLVMALLVQAVVGWRDVLASRVPGLAEPLGAALKPLGLAVGLERNRAALTIESFELNAGKLPGQLELSALIRNRSAYPVAFPAMELNLSGSSGSVLVRKVIPAQDYLGKPGLLERGIGSQSEWPVRLTLETDGLQASGYSVDLFYP